MKQTNFTKPQLLEQPDPILEHIQTYLGPRSATRLEAVHPRLRTLASRNNRYWKDAFIREAKKGNRINQLSYVDEFAASDLLELQRQHPNPPECRPSHFDYLDMNHQSIGPNVRGEAQPHSFNHSPSTAA